MKDVQLKNMGPVSNKLTDAVVQNLAGPDIVYYNCETNAWNTDKYNGYSIGKQTMDTERVKAFKTAMEKMPEFSAQYEFAAAVTKTIDSVFYNGWAKPVLNPQYNRRGTAIVGNIVVKNKATGKYELYCKSWVGVGDYVYPYDAVRIGACGFAGEGARFAGFRKGLVAAHTR